MAPRANVYLLPSAHHLFQQVLQPSYQLTPFSDERELSAFWGVARSVISQHRPWTTFVCWRMAARSWRIWRGGQSVTGWTSFGLFCCDCWDLPKRYRHPHIRSNHRMKTGSHRSVLRRRGSRTIFGCSMKDVSSLLIWFLRNIRMNQRMRPAGLPSKHRRWCCAADTWRCCAWHQTGFRWTVVLSEQIRTPCWSN